MQCSRSYSGNTEEGGAGTGASGGQTLLEASPQLSRPEPLAVVRNKDSWTVPRQTAGRPDPAAARPAHWHRLPATPQRRPRLPHGGSGPRGGRSRASSGAATTPQERDLGCSHSCRKPDGGPAAGSHQPDPHGHTARVPIGGAGQPGLRTIPAHVPGLSLTRELPSRSQLARALSEVLRPPSSEAHRVGRPNALLAGYGGGGPGKLPPQMRLEVTEGKHFNAEDGQALKERPLGGRGQHVQSHRGPGAT